MRLQRIREYFSTSYWVLPGIILALAVGAAIGTTAIDRWLQAAPEGRELQLAFAGSAEAAREILATIAGSMLTITGVVFSITVLVLQLASSQFSPRALRTFLRDSMSKVALGVFLGTFAFALVGLRSVRSEDVGGGFVPGLTVTFAFGLVIVSLGLFLYYIHHIATEIRVTSIIHSIGEETIGVMERSLREEQRDERPSAEEPPPMVQEIRSRHTGVVVNVDTDGLVQSAKAEGIVVALVPDVGAFVPRDSVLLRTSAEVDERTAKRLAASVTLATERTLEQDIEFGFRELTDIALRVLSPSTNDPTTALNVIDAEHDLLRRLGRMPPERERHRDDQGDVRLFVTRSPFEAKASALFEEIGDAGGDFPRIRERLRAVAEDLVEYLPPERSAAITLIAARWLPTEGERSRP